MDFLTFLTILYFILLICLTILLFLWIIGQLKADRIKYQHAVHFPPNTSFPHRNSQASQTPDVDFAPRRLSFSTTTPNNRSRLETPRRVTFNLTPEQQHNEYMKSREPTRPTRRIMHSPLPPPEAQSPAPFQPDAPQATPDSPLLELFPSEEKSPFTSQPTNSNVPDARNPRVVFSEDNIKKRRQTSSAREKIDRVLSSLLKQEEKVKHDSLQPALPDRVDVVNDMKGRGMSQSLRPRNGNKTPKSTEGTVPLRKPSKYARSPAKKSIWKRRTSVASTGVRHVTDMLSAWRVMRDEMEHKGPNSSNALQRASPNLQRSRVPIHVQPIVNANNFRGEPEYSGKTDLTYAPKMTQTIHNGPVPHASAAPFRSGVRMPDAEAGHVVKVTQKTVNSPSGRRSSFSTARRRRLTSQ